FHIVSPPLDIFLPEKLAKSMCLCPTYHYNPAIHWPIRLQKVAAWLLPILPIHIINVHKQISNVTWPCSPPSMAPIIPSLPVKALAKHSPSLTRTLSLSQEAACQIQASTPMSH